MNSRMEPSTSLNRLDGSSHLLREVTNFEAVFHVPPSHYLVVVRSRRQAGAVAANFWEHDEYDAIGQLVARYKCFQKVNAEGKRQSGWQKFSRDGELICEARDFL